MTPTCQASGAHGVKYHRVSPKAFKIPGSQDICHALGQCVIMKIRQLCGQGGRLKLCWHQDLHVTVGHHHCHLTQGCADVCKTNFVSLGVANAPTRCHHHLQEVPQHRLGFIPQRPM